MRKLSRILTIAMLVMAIIIIPLGISTILMAWSLGLVFDALSCILLLCLYIAFTLYELREFILDYEWYLSEASTGEMCKPSESGGEDSGSVCNSNH